MSGRLWLPPSGAKELWCTRFGGTCKRNSGFEALGLRVRGGGELLPGFFGLNRKTLGALSCPPCTCAWAFALVPLRSKGKRDLP